MRLPQWFKLKVISVISLFGSLLYSSVSFAVDIPREHFPIEAYSQEVHTYISPKNPGYTENLLTPEYQKLRLKQFYRHYYSSDANGLSPWSSAMVNAVLPGVKKAERDILAYFNNQTKNNAHKHYAENFREHHQTWWRAMQQNLNLDALNDMVFRESKRAIVVRNTFSRALPDDAPDFFDERVAGEGFPFDNFQIASLWVGTPLYVLHTSKDKAWSLVLTPDAYFAWVKSSDIARTSSDFIKQWQHAAQKNMVAITQTKASVLNKQQQFQFSGYIGAVFPLIARHAEQTSLLIPIKNAEGQAVAKTGVIETTASELMPMPLSPKNMANMMKQLQHRPYGWGGAFFLNDCSQELKNMFTPFGIWLPRSSWSQQKLNHTIDLSKYTLDERLRLLKLKGRPLRTLMYKGGHIMLYVGQAKINHQSEAISYQNVWALSPKNSTTRYVIGGAVFLPIMKNYSVSPNANSQANEAIFKLVQLDELSDDASSPQAFADNFR